MMQPCQCYQLDQCDLNNKIYTNPVDILVHVVGHVVVDHVSNSRDGSYCSSNQNVLTAHRDIVKGLFPLPMEPVTVDAGGGESLLAQVTGQEIGILRLK